MAGYASGIVAESVLYNMFYTYFVVFLTDVAFVKPLLAGIISFVSILWDGVTDPFIGHISDKPGFDKRRMLKVAIIPMSVLFVLAFQSFEMSQTAMFIYYTLAAMLFWLAYTLYTIPYYALCAEMTSDYDERTKIRGVSSMINAGAIFIGAAAPVVLVEIFEKSGISLGVSWTLSVAAVAAIALVFGFITHRSVKGISLVRQKNESGSFIKTFADLLKLRPFKFLLVFIGVFMIQSSLGQANLMYLLKDRMGVDPDEYMVYALLAIVGGMVVFVPLVTWLSGKRDRRFAVILSCTAAAAVMYAFAFFGITNLISLIILLLAYSLSIASFWTTLYAFSYDICELDEYVNGKRREGAITSLPQFLQKAGAAVGMLIIGSVLAIYKYDATLPVQSLSTALGIESINTIICPTIMLISVVFMALYPITKKRFNILSGKLKDKKDGNPQDTIGIEKLI